MTALANRGRGRPERGSMSLLVGGAGFWERLQQDIREARSYVYVQTLSFEGDRAGGGLTEALLASPAGVKRVMVDSVTKHVINDRWLRRRKARNDEVLQHEVRATLSMFDRLERNGVPVRFTWPIVGLPYHQLILRNHKKLVVIDDRVSYIGGINFSDHNFKWHDLMVRIDNPAVAAFFRNDFEQTWEGRDHAAATVIGGDMYIIADGRGNRPMRDAVTRVIRGARRRILLQCPYVSQPFWSLLGEARRRGVEVTVIMPQHNNRSVMNWGTLNAARRHGFELRFLPGVMTHMKALLVDDTTILGSANFDFVSFWHQPEIMLLARRPGLQQELSNLVLGPDLERSVPATPIAEGLWRQKLAALSMAAAKPLAAVARAGTPFQARAVPAR